MHIVRFALCVVLQVYTVNLVSKTDNELLKVCILRNPTSFFRTVERFVRSSEQYIDFHC